MGHAIVHAVRHSARNSVTITAGFLFAVGALSFTSLASAGPQDPAAGTVDASAGAGAQPSAAEVSRARTIAEGSRDLSSVLRAKGMKSVDAHRAPRESAGHTAPKILLTYDLKEPIRGRTTLLGEKKARNGSAPRKFDVPIQSLSEIDVTVDPTSGEVLSIVPGFGARYDRPEPGDSLPLADGTVFTFTETNFIYHEDIAAIQLLGLPETGE
jgi:hypothetical protein